MKKLFYKNKIIFIMYLIAAPMMAFTSVLFSKALGPLLDAVNYPEQGQFATVAITALVITIIDTLAAGMHRTIRERLRRGFLVELREKIFESILRRSIVEFGKHDSSYYINMLNRDVNKINSSYFDSVCGIYRVIMSFIITFCALFFLNPYITLLTLSIAFLSVMLPRLFEKKLKAAQIEASESAEQYMKQLKDCLGGFSTIRLFNIREVIQEKMFQKNFSQQNSEYRSIVLNYWTAWISMLCSVLCYILTICIGVWMVLRGEMTTGEVLAISQLIGGILAPFEELPIHITELKSIKPLREKIENFIQDTDVYEEKAVQKVEKCEISLENVNFSYTGESNQLENISYVFEEGKKYVIVGESGSGKTTLAKAVMGFFPNVQGKVLLDKKDISSYSQKQLYEMINYIQQDIFLFQDTLYNNITLYKNYTDEQVQKVIHEAGLDEVISNLGDGLNSLLDENGSNFSGGERQRIGLARALLLGVRYMVLDETTASLDAILENKIEQTILALNGVGSIIITHRLNPYLLQRCDGIIVMKDGAIIETGTFESLMAKKEYFYSFYTINHKEEYASIVE